MVYGVSLRKKGEESRNVERGNDEAKYKYILLFGGNEPAKGGQENTVCKSQEEMPFSRSF